MEAKVDIKEKIRNGLLARNDVKTVESDRADEPDMILTGSDGTKMIIEVKERSALDVLDVIQVSEWKKRHSADGAILVSAAIPAVSVTEAAAKVDVRVLSPNEILRNIEREPVRYLNRSVPPVVPKVYDIFVSHSSDDKSIAEKIALRLRADGLQVWYDDWEILVGHDIVDKVYDGIRNSRFLLVLLSVNSVSSKWVQQEINAARIREIESEATIVLPAVIELGAKSLIPESLKTKHYADIAGNFESAIQEIEYAVSVIKMTIATPKSVADQTMLNYENDFREIASTDLASYGWKMDEPFLQILITPSTRGRKIPKQNLENIVDSSTIEIRGYGGAAFPYRRTYPGVTEIHHEDGFGIVDNHAWPYEDWSFHYWYFSELAYFITHRHLSEEHMANIPRGTLALEWLELDVARSVMFARKLESIVEGYSEAVIEFQLHGMKNRQLIILNRTRTPLIGSYISSDDDIEANVILTKDADLVQIGMDILLDIVWRFGWRNPPVEVLRKDMASFFSGRFPE
jgi:hypothetical protein